MENDYIFVLEIGSPFQFPFKNASFEVVFIVIDLIVSDLFQFLFATSRLKLYSFIPTQLFPMFCRGKNRVGVSGS